MKKCRICGEEKELSNFHIAKGNKDNHENRCKKCKYDSVPREQRLKYGREYHSKNKDKANQISRKRYKNKKCEYQKYAAENRERINENRRDWRKRNPEKDKATAKKYREKNKVFLRELNKKWRGEQTREYFDEINRIKRERYNSDQDLRNRLMKRCYKNRKKHQEEKSDIWLKNNIRIRILNFLSYEKERKNERTIELIGCDYSFLFRYLDNRGYNRDAHDIDHIVPLSAFDIGNKEHRLVAFHYLNMWPEDKYYNRHIKQNKVLINWRVTIKSICKERGIDPQEILTYISGKLDSGKLRVLCQR